MADAKPKSNKTLYALLIGTIVICLLGAFLITHYATPVKTSGSNGHLTGTIYTSNYSVTDTTTQLRVANLTVDGTLTANTAVCNYSNTYANVIATGNMTAGERVTAVNVIASGNVTTTNIVSAATFSGTTFSGTTGNIVTVSANAVNSNTSTARTYVASGNITTPFILTTSEAYAGSSTAGSMWIYFNSSSNKIGLCLRNTTTTIAVNGVCSG